MMRMVLIDAPTLADVPLPVIYKYAGGGWIVLASALLVCLFISALLCEEEAVEFPHHPP